MLAPPPEADGAGGTGRARRGGPGLPAPAPPLAEVIWGPRGGSFLAPRVPDGDSGRWETVLAVWPLSCASAGAPRTPGPDLAGRGAALLPRPWTVEVRRHWRREKLTGTGSPSCVRQGLSMRSRITLCFCVQPVSCGSWRAGRFRRTCGGRTCA